MANLEQAVQNMINMCNDNRHGYDQARRWGPDYDCSSAIITAIKNAGFDTGSSSYTGNMSSQLCARGWARLSPSTQKQRGDILLNDINHVALFVGNNQLAEFSINEHGGITGGQPGDQTGGESRVRSYYDYPWNCILRYTGILGAPDSNTNDSIPQMPRYRVKTVAYGWLDWMHGLVDTSGSNDDFAGIQGHKIIDIEIENLGPNGWYSLNKTSNGIQGITVYYDTPNPSATGYWKAMYCVAPIGKEYLKWEYDNEDGGAGNDQDVIDRFKLTLSK